MDCWLHRTTYLLWSWTRIAPSQQWQLYLQFCADLSESAGPLSAHQQYGRLPGAVLHQQDQHLASKPECSCYCAGHYDQGHLLGNHHLRWIYADPEHVRCDGRRCPGTKCFSHSWTGVYIPAITGGTTAYAGFTAGTSGGSFAPATNLLINNFTYTPNTRPALPTTRHGMPTLLTMTAPSQPPARSLDRAGNLCRHATVAISTSTSPHNYICYVLSATTPALYPHPDSKGGCSAGTLYTGPVSISSTSTLYAMAGSNNPAFGTAVQADRPRPAQHPRRRYLHHRRRPRCRRPLPSPHPEEPIPLTNPSHSLTPPRMQPFTTRQMELHLLCLRNGT